LVHDRQQTLFALRDLAKDLGLALRMFARNGAETPLTRSARDVVASAAASTPDFDIAALASRYRHAAAATDACRPVRAGARANA
jgi:3-hydroxyisobutyrate dehydrogenase-like beta-hydroxyacid dehydrogenase